MQSNLSMFADDHEFYEIDNYVCTIQTKLQGSALKATSWYESNSLKVAIFYFSLVVSV